MVMAQAIPKILIGVVASGLLLALAMPPKGLWFVGWIALVPLLLATRNGSGAVAFLAGLFASLLCAGISSLGWFIPVGLSDADPSWVWTAYSVFGVYLGIVLAVWSQLKELNRWTLVFIPSLAIALEFLSLIYLPLHLGLSQFRCQPVVWLASLVGIWGVSWLVWWFNLTVAAAVANRQFATAIPVGLAALWALFGSPITKMAATETVSIGIWQTESVDFAQVATAFPKADLVILPELGGMFAAPSGDTSALQQASIGAPAFVTSFERPGEPKPQNVAALFSRGAISETYAKQRLFAGERNIRSPGNSSVAVPITVKLSSGQTWASQLGINICFDSCYPSILLDVVNRQHADWIALPTLDPPTPNGIVQGIHAAYTPFRSAELGVPILRCDITAYSLATSADGAIVSEMGLGEQQSKMDVPVGRRWTLFGLIGNWIPFGFIALAVWAGFCVRRGAASGNRS